MPNSAIARALVSERPRRLVLHEIPLPDVCDDDALVRVQACGLCGTDHEQYTPANSRADSRSSPATRRSGSSRRSGDVVAVLGPGIRGLCAAAAAKDAGAEFVMMTGLGDRDAEDLLATMAGERDDVPPVHRVVTP